jgi:triosephosphate isomerase (TIM)
MKTIIGNWKMNLGARESVALARGVMYAIRGKKFVPDIVICPSFTALSEVRKVIARSSVLLGAQDMSHEEKGAFTGEVSAKQLTELSVSHVIIGHSERRHYHQESDQAVQAKVKCALEKGLVPIVCIGEEKEDRAEGNEVSVIIEQIKGALKGISLQQENKLFIAYEPLWAIGSGSSAEPAQVVEMHGVIRKTLSELMPGSEGKIKVLYGGSVNPENVHGYLREQEVDGILVGGASVKLSQMRGIISQAMEVVESYSTK